jgi:nitrite reductase/ring-hydroxylating ferredoxin subunit
MKHHVAAADEMWNGDLVGATVGVSRIVLAKIDGVVHAYADRCAHLGQPLSQGTLDGAVLTCAAHHWQYDATTGRGVNPATTALVRYSVTVDAGRVFVEVP